MDQPRVVVTGMGCITPLGLNVTTTWEGIVRGRSGVAPITLFDASDLKTRFAAEVKDFDPVHMIGRKSAHRADRFAQFALVAAAEAVEHAGLHKPGLNLDRIGVIIGTGIGGVWTLFEQSERFFELGPHKLSPFLPTKMLPDSAAAQLAIEYNFRGPSMALSTACASGTDALGEAAAYIRRGEVDVMLAGGSEAAVTALGVAGFNVIQAISTRNEQPQAASRPFERDRDGFVMGEGAAVMVLEALPHATARGAEPLAEIIGYGSTNDAYHIAAPSPEGAGAALCMKKALQSARLTPDEIDYINAHGTGTKLNDISETLAIKKIFGDAAFRIPVSSTKSMIGHLLGAAGALEALVCIQALHDQVAPPTINYQTPDPECDLDYVPNQARRIAIKHAMSNSFGFGGHNATLIFGFP